MLDFFLDHGLTIFLIICAIRAVIFDLPVAIYEILHGPTHNDNIRRNFWDYM